MNLRMSLGASLAVFGLFSTSHAAGQSIYYAAYSQNAGRHVVVVDQSNGRIQTIEHIDLDQTTGPINRPYQALPLSNGEIWVTDDVTGSVHVWDNNGVDYLREEASGSFDLFGIVEHAGAVWIAARVLGGTGDAILRIQGGVSTQFPVPFDPQGLMVHGSQLLISHTGGVTPMDPSTGTLGSLLVSTPFQFTGQPTPRLSGDHFWLPVSVSGTWNVREYDAAGNQVRGWPITGSALSSLSSISELGNGLLLLAGTQFGGNNSSLVITDQDGTFFVPILDEVSIHYASLGPNPLLGSSYCDPAQANSSGLPATLAVTGSLDLTENALHLAAHNLPEGVFGYFLNGRAQGMIPFPSGSMGILCLGGGPIGRYNAVNEIQFSTEVGFIGLVVDPSAMPQPTTPVPIFAGETWNFQGWYRDTVGGQPASNFTSAVSVTF